MCRSVPTNRLPPWIFNPCLKQKRCLPLFAPVDHHVCPDCPFTAVGIDITIGSIPMRPTFNPTSLDVLPTITANADTHLQTYEKRKLGQANKTSSSTNTLTHGNDLIHDLLQRYMILLPFAIAPMRSFGPILQNFLVDTPPGTPITFLLSKRHGIIMYSKLLSFPSPKGLFKLANHNWKANPTHHFFGYSYSAPTTPSIDTIQQLGLSITKAFGVVQARVGHYRNIPNPRAGPSFSFFVPTAKYDDLVTS
jgi:hypothetical protein